MFPSNPYSLRSIDPVKFFAIKNKTFESWVELLNFLRHPGTIMDSLKEYWPLHLCDAVWNLFDHLWTLLVHWKLAQKFSTHFIKSFKNVVPSTHAKTWLYFPLFFQTRSAKFPGYKESQLIKQQILRLFGSLPFGQLRVLVVTKGQKISEDLFLVFKYFKKKLGISFTNCCSKF